MASVFGLMLLGLAAVAALPYDPVIRKLDSGLRYQYIRGPDGTPHLVDLWGKTSDLVEASRYSPDRQNVYHLFTRQNPTVSQPLLLGNESHLATTNYNANRRTVVLLHGWLESPTVDFITVVVPAYLAAEDVNVIVVDWRAGSSNLNYFIAVQNTKTSGESIARFLTWLNTASGASLSMYHLVGFSLSGQQVGIIGRNLGGNVAYITSLDPPFLGWVTNKDKFRSTDGVYTELIHTSAGFLGYMMPLADVDFYPNKGLHMPGCVSQHCSHERSFYYLAESLTSGGFTGRRCPNYMTAISATCQMSETLRMGGLVPKTGQSGVYQVFTNAAPPFSMG